MSTTTMDAVALTSPPVTETPPTTEAPPTSEASKPAAKSFLRPVADVLGVVPAAALWVWRFDVGATVLIGEQTARFVKAAVDRGKEVEPSIIKPFKKAEHSVTGALDEVGERLKGIGKAATPSTDNRLEVEVHELSERINELTQRIESLQVKQDTGGHRKSAEAGH